MTEAALSQREFDTWREDDKVFKDQVLVHMAAQVTLNLATHGRVTILETNQEKCRSKMVNTTTWLSAVVSAIVGGLFGWLSK
jgi:hypothetical protein